MKPELAGSKFKKALEATEVKDFMELLVKA